jgi:hypothetical protein
LSADSALSQPPPNDAIQELSSILGDDATREIVRLFLNDFPGSLRSLGSGTREQQLMIAHGLKSSALHMGARQLSVRMAALENRLDGPSESITPEDIVGAAADFEEFAPLLRRYAEP